MTPSIETLGLFSSGGPRQEPNLIRRPLVENIAPSFQRVGVARRQTCASARPLTTVACFQRVERATSDTSSGVHTLKTLARVFNEWTVSGTQLVHAPTR